MDSREGFHNRPAGGVAARLPLAGGCLHLKALLRIQPFRSVNIHTLASLVFRNFPARSLKPARLTDPYLTTLGWSTEILDRASDHS